MLFKNFSNNHDQFRLNEGNFISKDFTKIFDTDASYTLSKLTIDKLFEGLDFEKSEDMYNFIKSNIPSIASSLGMYNASNLFAFDLIKNQISYIITRIIKIETELAEGFKSVLDATQTNYGERKKKISQITNPMGLSSIIPIVNTVVKNYIKTNNIDFKSEQYDSLKQSFISLHSIPIEKTANEYLKNIEYSSQTFGLKAIYTIIDALKMPKIEPESARCYPKNFVGIPLKSVEYMTSEDVYDRLAGFFEMIMNSYPVGKQLTEKFGVNYININLTSEIVGPDAVLSLMQLVPAMDARIFQPMSELLNEVSSILIRRVFLQSPDEDLKNIFTPTLQVMYMCMLSIVSLKLINLNLEVESLVIKTEEQIKKDAEKKVYDERVQRVKNLLDVTNKLESMNFLKSGGLVYKVGPTKMSPEVIKLINNYFVILKFLPQSKFNDSNYDVTTAQGVTKFQETYGLKYVDGKIGNETKGEMKIVANDYKIKYNIQNVESGVMGSSGL
jgi:hypothetical protein